MALTGKPDGGIKVKVIENKGNMKTFVLEGYDRFPMYDIRLPNLDSEMALALQQLCRPLPAGKSLTDLTCNIVHLRKRSITGDDYLAEKVIKYKVTVIVEAQLVDDVEVTTPP
jgi:hypothetical protein